MPDRTSISLSSALEADPLLAGKVQIADNGGADLLYWTGPDAERAPAVARMRAVVTTVPGVLASHDRTNPWLRLGPEAGDVVVFCQAGWRFSDPDPVTDNPIPGNHGHPATRHIPFFIGGGLPARPARRGVAPARPHRRRRADRGGVLRRREAQGRVRRAQPLVAASRASALRTTPGSVVVHIGGRLALRKRP